MQVNAVYDENQNGKKQAISTQKKKPKKIKNKKNNLKILLLELFMPEKEPEKFEGNFRTVAGPIISLAEKEKIWTQSIHWYMTFL